MILGFILIAQLQFPAWFPAELIPGTAMTWTDVGHTRIWAGNPYCFESGTLLSSNSPAIDAAEKKCKRIEVFTLECQTGPQDTPANSIITVPTRHCPLPGSALNQPRLADGHDSYCQEWYGAGPDIGACEFVPGLAPDAPKSIQVL